MDRANIVLPATLRETSLTRRSLLLGAGGGVLALTLPRLVAPVQAAPARADDYPEVTITAHDFSFDIPADLPGGLVRMTVANKGEHTHQVLLIQLDDATTPEMIEAAVALPEYTELLALGICKGGPNAAEPGKFATTIVDLPAGDYLAVCLVSDATTKPHYLLGMAAPVTVSTAAAEHTAPAADLTIDLVDFHFAHLPAEIAAGPQVWEITNSGTVTHELVLFEQAPGVSFDMILGMFGLAAATPLAGAAMVATPNAPAGPPFMGVAGVTPIGTGVTNWAVLDLAPGNYFAICFIPSVDHGGAPHFVLGMIMPIVVR